MISDAFNNIQTVTDFGTHPELLDNIWVRKRRGDPHGAQVYISDRETSKLLVITTEAEVNKALERSEMMRDFAKFGQSALLNLFYLQSTTLNNYARKRTEEAETFKRLHGLVRRPR